MRILNFKPFKILMLGKMYDAELRTFEKGRVTYAIFRIVKDKKMRRTLKISKIIETAELLDE